MYPVYPLAQVSTLHYGKPGWPDTLFESSEIPGYQLNMLVQFSCEVKLFCVQNYYEAEQGWYKQPLMIDNLANITIGR
jgi:hypothetical protein